MIILDDTDDPHNSDKLSDDSRSVVRPSTPTPSLPSYEFSQALNLPRDATLEQPVEEPVESKYLTWWQRYSKARFRRALLYALVIYFFLTVTVGVPIIVIKLRQRSSQHQKLFPPGPTASDSVSFIVGGSESFSISSAVGCNQWSEENSTQSMLEYALPLSDLVFIQSNVSYATDSTTVQDISGTLDVGVNADPSVTEAIVSVSMQYSDEALKERTHVCLMNISDSNGVYLYVPSNLTSNDTLIFNMTFLFPQTPSLLHVNEFLTMLPHFTQWFTNLSPYVTFDRVSLGGPRSKVSVRSMDANSLVVKTALAEIEGTFNVTESLVLDTVSAPINVNVTLTNTGDGPVFLDVGTGNAELSAAVHLNLSPTLTIEGRMPDFMTRFQTFNAPLALVIMHDPNSAAGILDVRVENSMGEALVSVDNMYTGFFDVMTTFATAEVLTSSVDSINALSDYDMSMYKSALSSSTTPGSAAERNVDFDVIHTSRIIGWVGTGTRPSAVPGPKHHSGQGSIEVMSTLSPVALLLGP
ncbi:uncharacterized protein LAESUDRAFT_676365 [Laetiporus sulphureus 93-53]|uniref:Transmembrane protein n=1 Tax=Laetiporus sulphureus 93-53 TaxID=1314785 RepID=A0A165F492_9APHY|nr:uncharacterized protein LAESUDRAFT_676365 [Laetiporus sulphureus 93-53]KZT08352.1 hypothetical protein LAESUDRAFT_676365 [Laetiporus sulphureus 93-53]